MRVLAVDHTAGIVTFRARYEALARDPGIDLTVLAPESWTETGRTERIRPAESGYRIRTGRMGWRGLENRAFFRGGLLGALRAVRPDVLHLAVGPFAVYALQAALAARVVAPGAKVLFQTLDNLHRGFRYPYRPSAFYARVERAMYRLSSAAIAGCGEAGDVLRARGYAKPIVHLPLAVDPAVHRPRAAPRAADAPFTVGFVGRLLPMKGLDVLASALDGLPGRWACVVVGRGPARAELERAARAGGWDARLRILDSVAHADVAGVLGAMDALVVPSRTTPRWKEQFGRVLIEAMACEVPVIGSDSGAIPETTGRAGLIVPEGDAAALRAVLVRLMDDGALRARLAAAGRARVLRHFTWEGVARAQARVYRALLDGSLESEAAPSWSEPDPEAAAAPDVETAPAGAAAAP
jgi:glycosyltransferase involved in cell wall biosynthesis